MSDTLEQQDKSSAPISEERESVARDLEKLAGELEQYDSHEDIDEGAVLARRAASLLRAPQQAEPVAGASLDHPTARAAMAGMALTVEFDPAPVRHQFPAAPPPDDEAVRLLRDCYVAWLRSWDMVTPMRDAAAYLARKEQG